MMMSSAFTVKLGIKVVVHHLEITNKDATVRNQDGGTRLSHIHVAALAWRRYRERRDTSCAPPM